MILGEWKLGRLNSYQLISKWDTVEHSSFTGSQIMLAISVDIIDCVSRGAKNPTRENRVVLIFKTEKLVNTIRKLSLIQNLISLNGIV